MLAKTVQVRIDGEWFAGLILEMGAQTATVKVFFTNNTSLVYASLPKLNVADTSDGWRFPGKETVS